MILPERTVDAWLAAFFATRERHARLWAPVERNPNAWDLVAGVGALGGPKDGTDKVAIFENKGVTDAGNWILRFDQHVRHRELDRRFGGDLVYYVLPVPPWQGPQQGFAAPPPRAALHRTDKPFGRGFSRWALVVHVEDLDGYLLWLQANGQAVWAGAAQQCVLSTAVGGVLPSVALERFYQELRRCRAGKRAPLPNRDLDLTQGVPQTPADWAKEASERELEPVWEPQPLPDLPQPESRQGAYDDMLRLIHPLLGRAGTGPGDVSPISEFDEEFHENVHVTAVGVRLA